MKNFMLFLLFSCFTLRMGRKEMKMLLQKRFVGANAKYMRDFNNYL